jgi:hypothetical protein
MAAGSDGIHAAKRARASPNQHSSLRTVRRLCAVYTSTPRSTTSHPPRSPPPNFCRRSVALVHPPAKSSIVHALFHSFGRCSQKLTSSGDARIHLSCFFQRRANCHNRCTALLLSVFLGHFAMSASVLARASRGVCSRSAWASVRAQDATS